MIPLPWRLGVAGLLLVAVAAAVLAYGHRQYRAGEAAVQARWDAANAAAERSARERERRWIDAATESDARYADAVHTIQSRDAVLRDYDRRLREYAARERARPVPGTPADPGSPCDATAERQRAAEAAGAVAALAAEARHTAAERDQLAEQVRGLIEAWPR